jgi:hypothetical protein
MKLLYGSAFRTAEIKHFIGRADAVPEGEG